MDGPAEGLGVELLHDQLDAELHVLVESVVGLEVAVDGVVGEVDELEVGQVVDVGDLLDRVGADLEVGELFEGLEVVDGGDFVVGEVEAF